MKILVLNCGSSSLKYSLFDSLQRIDSGLIERIGDYGAAIRSILDQVGEFDAVGHRVVHGGEYYRDAVIIDAAVIETIKSLIPLAPLHNPANLAGIRALMRYFPSIPQVAVFDTAFHQTLPDYAYRYALPKRLYAEEKIRRYGFHGTSHRYLLHAAAHHLGRDATELNLITFHLGNGDSVCAIRNGVSVDTSMGFTPLEGLIMGTRSGDIDPEIPLFLERELRMGPGEIDTLLNRESGLKGICGHSDMRDVAAAALDGNSDARLAIDMFAYHAKKYLGAYLAILGRVDAIVFSGGIGEHAAIIRQKILEGMEGFGIAMDPKIHDNKDLTDLFCLSSRDADVSILVIHTDEEWEIARETLHLLEQEVHKGSPFSQSDATIIEKRGVHEF